MKRILAILFSIMLVLTGCGGETPATDKKEETKEEVKVEKKKEEKAPQLDTSGPPTKLEITEKPEQISSADSFTIKGITEPKAKVILIYDDKVMSEKEADDKGHFEFTSVALTQGIALYEVRAKAEGHGDGTEIVSIEIK